MQGKMELRPKFIANNKPEDVTLPDGTVVKTIMGREDPNVLVRTRVIDLRK